MNGARVLEIIEDKSLFKPYGYINGEWISSEKEKSFSIHNPSDGKIIATMPEMGIDDTKYAIESANQAFQTWSKKTPKERCIILRRGTT